MPVIVGLGVMQRLAAKATGRAGRFRLSKEAARRFAKNGCDLFIRNYLKVPIINQIVSNLRTPVDGSSCEENLVFLGL